MDTAKLFQSGRSQAVRLPKAYRFSGKQVFVKKFGRAVLLMPEAHSWDLMFDACDEFSKDFMQDRNQPTFVCPLSLLTGVAFGEAGSTLTPLAADAAQKQIPISPPPGRDRGKTEMKHPKIQQFHKSENILAMIETVRNWRD